MDVTNLLGMARTAALAGNNVEAMEYYNRVLEIDPRCSEAWLGKGKAAGWASTLAVFRMPEVQVAFTNAIGAADDDQKQEVATTAADEMNKLVAMLYGAARNHLMEYVSLANSWPTYLNQMGQLLAALDQAAVWDPSNRTTFENIEHLCKDNIEGVAYRDQFNQNAPGLLSLSAEYEATLRTKREHAIVRLREIDPGYEPPSVVKKQSESCFVVTATMGDADHPTVRLMRRYRDEHLAPRRAGAALVAVYYRIGPVAADIIRDRPLLRRLSYCWIVRPAAKIAAQRIGRKRKNAR
jgi:tetratricopeptide (TPR) repeat protein